MKSRSALLLMSTIFAAWVFVATPTTAQVVKCKGPSGKTVYSDRACADTETSQAVNTNGGGVIDGSGMRRYAQQFRDEERMTALTQNPPKECRFKHFTYGDSNGKQLAAEAKQECIANIVARERGLSESTASRDRFERQHNQAINQRQTAAVARPQPQAAVLAGSQTRCTPDGFGGARCRDSNGNSSRITSDGFGGGRITAQNGNSSRYNSDGFGGTRITGPNGSVTRCTPDGFGGTRCN